jgi:hypothetical protein
MLDAQTAANNKNVEISHESLRLAILILIRVSPFMPRLTLPVLSYDKNIDSSIDKNKKLEKLSSSKKHKISPEKPLINKTLRVHITPNALALSCYSQKK